MITIEEALRIALEAHEGQKDLDGNPVILHPMAVALAGRNRQEQIAGLLHDVVEDTDFTFDDLLQRGVDESIVDTLRLLTHSKDMTYEEYVKTHCNIRQWRSYTCEIQRFVSQLEAWQGWRAHETGS